MIDQALIERVRSGEGADRRVDIAICLAVLSAKNHPAYWNWQSMRPRDEPDKPVALFWKQFAPAYTTDLNAVLALIAEKLPGWWGSVEFGRRNVEAEILSPDNDPRPGAAAYAKSPARALLAAALLALNAKDDADDR